MLDLAALESHTLLALPLRQVLAVMVEKKDRETRQELWRRYIANVVTMWGGKGTKAFSEVLADYDHATKANLEADIAEAYETANATLEALEKARRG